MSGISLNKALTGIKVFSDRFIIAPGQSFDATAMDSTGNPSNQTISQTRRGAASAYMEGQHSCERLTHRPEGRVAVQRQGLSQQDLLEVSAEDDVGASWDARVINPDVSYGG